MTRDRFEKAKTEIEEINKNSGDSLENMDLEMQKQWSVKKQQIEYMLSRKNRGYFLG